MCASPLLGGLASIPKSCSAIPHKPVPPLGRTAVIRKREMQDVRYLRGIRMTKNNLTDQLTQTTQSSKKETELIIDGLLASITDALVKGEKVDLRGFGSFQV